MPPEAENNKEIADLLAEFEAKQGSGEIPKPASPGTIDVMQSQSSQAPQRPEASRIVRLIMKLSGGMIKSENQANFVLLGLVAIFFGISIYLFFF